MWCSHCTALPTREDRNMYINNAATLCHSHTWLAYLSASTYWFSVLVLLEHLSNICGHPRDEDKLKELFGEAKAKCPGCVYKYPHVWGGPGYARVEMFASSLVSCSKTCLGCTHVHAHGTDLCMQQHAHANLVHVYICMFMYVCTCRGIPVNTFTLYIYTYIHIMCVHMCRYMGPGFHPLEIYR